MKRARLLLVLLLGLIPGPAAAQQAEELDRAVDRIAASWARGDAAALASASARDGVSFDLGDERAGPLGARQTVAMLRRIFDDRETVSLRAGMTEVVGGEPARGFAELAWAARVRGTTIPERATVFLALVREPGGWRITSIRLLQ